MVGLTALAAASFLIVLTNRLIDGLVTPLFDKYLQNHKFWLMYVAWLAAGLLVFAAQINLVTPIIPVVPEWLGLVLTALVAGGGSNLLHDLFDQPILPFTRIAKPKS